jgi:hypothetical protein
MNFGKLPSRLGMLSVSARARARFRPFLLCARKASPTPITGHLRSEPPSLPLSPTISSSKARRFKAGSKGASGAARALFFPAFVAPFSALPDRKKSPSRWRCNRRTALPCLPNRLAALYRAHAHRPGTVPGLWAPVPRAVSPGQRPAASAAGGFRCGLRARARHVPAVLSPLPFGMKKVHRNRVIASQSGFGHGCK